MDGSRLLQVRVDEMAAALDAERAANAQLRSNLEHARSEQTRLQARYDGRMGAAASLQHDLESRLETARAELDEARAQVLSLEAAARAARQEDERRAKTPPELHSLRRENGALRTEVSGLREKLSLVGGRIKTLSGQADATSAEERSFLRMLSSMQKEQKEQENEIVDVAGVIQQGRRMRGSLPPPPPAAVASATAVSSSAAAAAAAATRARQPARRAASEGAAAAPLMELPLKGPKLRPLPPQASTGGGNAREGGGAVGEQPPKLPMPLGTGGKKVDDTPAAEAAGGGAGGSPRKGLHLSRRPPAQREIAAALDPEAAERKLQIDALRQRMKAIM